MHVETWVWFATIGGLLALLAFDIVVAARKGPHVIGHAEALRWVSFYVGLAVLFGIGIGFVSGVDYAGEFFAGYVTEYSLSVDNLFVFVIIMASFAVPPAYQHKVLLFGIVLALILRGIFIALGAAAIERFVFTFFVFGAFLIFTAIKLAVGHDQEAESESNKFVRLMRRVLPTTTEYDGAKIVTRLDGKRVVTPMLLVMLAIGSTDILFALDSIPAIFGLTEEPYIVFTANAFALMGLRQLYFLLDGLLDRLVYLSKGLAVILGFIGAKLILHAAHEYSWGKWAPDIGTFTSLGVIVVVLAITVVTSLRKTRRDAAEAGLSPAARDPLQ
ncbi:MAG TPA: TerC family protein [Mycobacteriales bacterium]|nr:TerC family protein [Mycobacteriales bacterium]